MRKDSMRILLRILKSSGALKFLSGYWGFFFFMALLIWLVEPAVPTYLDSLWYCFVAGTTIGFGDIAAVSPLGRVLTVIVAVYTIIIVAIFTALITNFFLEIAKLRANESAHLFMDRLERLPELSREELEEMSRQARQFLEKSRPNGE